MLGKEGADEAFEAKTDARTVSRAGPFDIDVEGTSEEIGVVIQRADSETLFVGKQGGDFVFGFSGELKVRLGRSIGRDVKGIAGGANFGRETDFIEEFTNDIDTALALLEDSVAVAEEDQFAHGKVPQPCELAHVGGFVTKTFPADAIGDSLGRKGEALIAMVDVVTNRGRETGFRGGHVGQRFVVDGGTVFVAGAKAADDAGIWFEMAGEGDGVGEGAEIIAFGEDIRGNERGREELLGGPVLFEPGEGGIEVAEELEWKTFEHDLSAAGHIDTVSGSSCPADDGAGHGASSINNFPLKVAEGTLDESAKVLGMMSGVFSLPGRDIEFKPKAVGRNARISKRAAEVSDLFENFFASHVRGGLAKLDCDCLYHAAVLCCRPSIKAAISRGVRAVIKSLSGMVTPNSCSRARSNSRTRTEEKPAS